MTRTPPAAKWLTSPAILVVGAVLYAIAEGPGGVTFYITPLAVGAIAALAGLAGSHRHLVPAGLGIAGWGVAVALVHYNVVPATRTTPAYMIGVAAGVLVTSYIAPRANRAAWTHSSVVAVVTAAIFYFTEFSVPSLGRWPAWAVSLVVWAAWETLQPVVRPSPVAQSAAGASD
ncbi:MAG: hypothetical protein M3Y91_18810 [Actinomycetota bacterium]|nr:hypothetical protein [Actinomycetota bacterium]